MKIVRIIRNLFLVIGIGLLAGAIAMMLSTESFLHHAVTVTGTVIGNDVVIDSQDRSETYRPRFEFQTPDGRNVVVRSNTGSNPPSFSEGDTVTVLYEPQSPEKAKIRSFAQLWLGTMILGILGGVFTAIGGGILLYGRLKTQTRTKLQETGQQIVAQVTSVERNGSVEVNGVLPYRITAQWLDASSGKVFLFHSDNIWFDPAQWVSAGRSVNVWIDPKDPRRYSMDTGFLPKPGND